VDGITATCLLTDFLRRNGCDCVPYIPGRLEEGYGLNPIAIEYLHGLGVQLIITVDCGITAVEEAQLCKSLGIDLVITDTTNVKIYFPRPLRWWIPIALMAAIPTELCPGWVLPLSWRLPCREISRKC
jgi:single-stranded-DNA-specific exonuclease